MDLSKQDRVVIAVIKSMEQMGLTGISTATELGTTSIHVIGKRGNSVEIIAIVDVKGNVFYAT